MTRILIPPGMGDSYWTLVKLPAFLRKMGYEKPELTVVSYYSADDSHLRSIPYLKLFDFFTIGDPPVVPNDPNLQAIWNEVYVGPGRSIIPDIQGFDWLMSYNGALGLGEYLENDELECNWYPRIQDKARAEMEFWAKDYRERFGQYALCFFPFYGSYASYWQAFSVESIAASLRSFLIARGLRPVFPGAAWEPDINPILQTLISDIHIPDTVDLVGHTTVIQLFGLMLGAEMIVGYQSGLTMMAAVLKKKVLTLWYKGQFHDNMRWACVPPDTRRKNYFAIDALDLTIDAFVNQMHDVYDERAT